MSRPFVLMAPSFLLLAACGKSSTEVTHLDYPVADLSTQSIDFGDVNWDERATRQFVLTNTGELDLGVKSISLTNSDGMEENYSVSYNPAEMTCPEATSDSAVSARTVAPTDTAGGGGTDTGGGGTGATGDSEVLDMPPGCQLTITVSYSPVNVGDSYGAVAVETATQSDYPKNGEPAWFRDATRATKIVMLHGNGVKGVGSAVVRPRNVDFGHLWTGESATRYITIENVGDGDLTITPPELPAECDPPFSLDTSPLPSDGVLAAGESTYFEVTWTPDDLNAAYCAFTIPGLGQDGADITVELKGNTGSDPSEKPPTVAIRYPPVGTVHDTSNDLELDVDMFDVNQPANTLTCKVKSRLAEASIANCNATDESGYVQVSIPAADLQEGTDTLLVQVTDEAGNIAKASTTVLWKASYPSSDDDGDGYGDDDPTADDYDCDDSEANTYPDAAELADGKDNDCDGAVDEGTSASDDDGDSVTEDDGDCDDNDADTYPGAPELPDEKDNNCDGVVDESTVLYDDDGDGFAEVDNDCNDQDPDISPAAVELCDGVDNNCNGLKDQAEGCVSTDTAPIIVGGIQMSADQVVAGDTVTMTVFVFDGDGQTASYNWQEDSTLSSAGYTAIDNPTAQTITWTAPPADKLSNPDGDVYNVYVVVQDPDGHQDWEFGKIAVYPNDTKLPNGIDRVTTVKKGCGGSQTNDTGVAFLLFPALGLAALRRRRRASKTG